MINLNIIYTLIFIFAAIKWGDWRNWKHYYPTFLFWIVVDLLYQFLFFQYSMWEYVPVGSDKAWAKHTHITLLIMLIKYPATLIIFLGHLPGTNVKRFIYILFWTFLYVAIEKIDLILGGIMHKHGWNLWWSSLFSLVMFTTLAIHYKRPLIAWVISVLFSIFLWNIFNISQSILK
ncbi:CBO0543 family protein [Bacillus sp. MRMR6]|uniref:CBO0543 family protein n=1 Tax=Bacillus sp. MRMR6 TaxID=1928617 RepID=UPI0020C99270|nr:CBO0543 family protein [Bacillus sp. MRMR6]